MTSLHAVESTRGGGRHRRPADVPEGSDATSVWWWLRSIVSWLLLLAMVGLLSAMVVVPRLAGAAPYTVLTGSMEPGLPPGTLIVVRPTPAEELQSGDVITFQPVSGDPAVVTHRIDGIFYNSEGERRIYTRGDANNVRDSWALEPAQIRGKVWYSVPYLGRLNSLLSSDSRSMLITAAGVALAGYAVWMFSSGFWERKGRREVSDDSSGGEHSPREDLPEGASQIPTTETK